MGSSTSDGSGRGWADRTTSSGKTPWSIVKTLTGSRAGLIMGGVMGVYVFTTLPGSLALTVLAVFALVATWEPRTTGRVAERSTTETRRDLVDSAS